MRRFAASALACTSSSGATTRSRMKRTSSSRVVSKVTPTAPCRREAPDRAQEGGRFRTSLDESDVLEHPHTEAKKFDAEIQRLRVDIGNGRLAVSVLPVRVHAREQLENSDEVHYFSPNIRRNRPVAPMLLP